MPARWLSTRLSNARICSVYGRRSHSAAASALTCAAPADRGRSLDELLAAAAAAADHNHYLQPHAIITITRSPSRQWTIH